MAVRNQVAANLAVYGKVKKVLDVVVWELKMIEFAVLGSKLIVEIFQ